MVLFYLIFPSVYQLRIMIFTARQTITVKCVQERIRVKFLYGIYTRSDPFSSQHHQCSAHCRNACCITDCLASNFMVAFLMIAHIIDIISLFFSIFYTGKNTADICFSFCAWTKTAGSGRSSFRNWIGTISCPLYWIGVVESIPTSSRQRI